MPRLPGEFGSLARMARPEFGFIARARDAGGAVGLHQRPAVGLLLIADLDHVDLDLDAEQLPGEGERRAPLAGAGLGRQLPDAGLAVVEGLRHGGVRLVAARRADALVLVEDAGRRIEQLSRAGGRERAAPAARACRCRAPAPGSRSRARSRPPARSAPSGRAAARSSGPIGLPVPGWSARRRRRGRSAAMLYQARGMRSSGRRYLTLSGMAFPQSL